MRLKEFLRNMIFLFIIGLSVLEIAMLSPAVVKTLKIVPGDIRLFKGILSWIIVGYFLYYLSVTELLFNDRQRKIDILILAAFYAFAFKDMSHMLTSEELHIFSILKDFLLQNSILNEAMFIIGSLLIFILAVYLGVIVSYEKSSLLGMIRRKKERRNLFDIAIDSTIIYIILLAVSYFIFTIVMEWFAVVLDSYIVVTALVYYFIVFYIFKKNLGFSNFVHSVIETGENFMKRFLNLFHEKKTIFYGITGIIVIHAMVDIGNFILPYVLNIKESFYLTNLYSGTHQTIINLLIKDYPRIMSFTGQLSIFFVYMQNIIALFFLLFIPFYTWIKVVNKREVKFSKMQAAIFFSSVICLIFAPIFKISAFENQVMVGVDISTHTLSNIGSVQIIALVSILWFFIIILLGSLKSAERIIGEIVILASMIFLGMYIYFFYSSTFMYYISTIAFLFGNAKFITVFYLIVYLITITLFYIAGFLLFMFEILDSEHVSFISLNMKVQKIIVFIWSMLLFTGFVILMDMGLIMEVSILLIASLILGMVLFRYEKEPARYILSVDLVLGSFLIVLLGVQIASIGAGLIELISRIALLFFISIIIMVLKQKKIWRSLKWSRIFIAIAAGAIFGYWFHVLNESKAALLYPHLSYIILFSLLIALTEELIFRFIILKAASGIFDVKTALLGQSIFFGLLHLMAFRSYMRKFGVLMLVSFFISLVIFGLITGILSIEKEKKINPVYAIICHAIADVLLYVIP